MQGTSDIPAGCSLGTVTGHQLEYCTPQPHSMPCILSRGLDLRPRCIHNYGARPPRCPTPPAKCRRWTRPMPPGARRRASGPSYPPHAQRMVGIRMMPLPTGRYSGTVKITLPCRHRLNQADSLLPKSAVFCGTWRSSTIQGSRVKSGYAAFVPLL